MTIEDLKPASTRRTRLLLASLIWTLVGAGLFTAGLYWLLESGLPAAALGLMGGLLIGGLKGRFVLAPRAEANARRIIEEGDDRCLGSVFSWRTWGLVLFFITLGAVLRRSPLPSFWLGVLYTGIGSGLAGASSVSWRLWQKTRA